MRKYALSVSVLLAIAPAMAAPHATAPPSAAANYNIADYSASIPAMAFSKTNDGFVVFDRSYGDLPGPDLAYQAVPLIMQRNPGLFEQLYLNVLGSHFTGIASAIHVDASTSASLRTANDTLRQLLDQNLRSYFDQVTAQLAVNPNLRASDLEAFTAPWYTDTGYSTLDDQYSAVICGVCGPGDKPPKGGACPSGQCVSDCGGTGTVCITIIVTPKPGSFGPYPRLALR